MNSGLIDMLEQYANKTVWVAPDPQIARDQRKGYGRALFTNDYMKRMMKNVAKENNDSLGYDLSTKEPIFRGSAIQYVPKLDADTTNPVYCVDHGTLYVVVLKDWFLKDIKYDKLPNQPTCIGIVRSITWNTVCKNLRQQAVFYA